MIQKFLLLLGIYLVSNAWALPRVVVDQSDPAIQKNPGEISFKSPPGEKEVPPLKTGKHKIEIIGSLYSEESPLPYVIFSAQPCPDCDAERAVHIYRADGKIHSDFSLPGKIRDAKKLDLVSETRAYYGKCVANRGDVYVVFQRERVDRRRGMQVGAYIAEAMKDRLEEKLISTSRELPRETHTLKQVRKKECFLVPSVDRKTHSSIMQKRPGAESAIEKKDDTLNEDD